MSYDPNGEMQLTSSFVGGVPGTNPDDVLSITELNARVGEGVQHTIEVIRRLVKEEQL